MTEPTYPDREDLLSFRVEQQATAGIPVQIAS